MSDSFVTPWTVAHQAPLFTGFPRQEYWSGLPFPPPEDLPNPGIKPESCVSCIYPEPPGKAFMKNNCFQKNVGDAGSIPGWKDPLKKEMAIQSSFLAWEIP